MGISGGVGVDSARQELTAAELEALRSYNDMILAVRSYEEIMAQELIRQGLTPADAKVELDAVGRLEIPRELEEWAVADLRARRRAVREMESKPDGAPVVPAQPQPEFTLGDRLAQYGRAITAAELSREQGISLNRISRRMKTGSLPYFHVCTRLRFCPITIARSTQTGFDRVDGPSLIERLIACDHDMDAKELAPLFYVSYKTIMKEKDQGTLPYYQEGVSVRFKGRAVAQWLMAQMYPGRSLDGVPLPGEPSTVPPRKPPKKGDTR
jgi:hypothetical protein